MNMGTNYYFHRNICKHCGRGDDPIHIGKSSYGWCFGLHVYIEDCYINPIHDLEEWKMEWSEPDSCIKDEYGEIIARDEMLKIITNRSSDNHMVDPKWYKENHAVPGPNNLARHKIDGTHCIGHGGGTWDLEIGEFS